MKRVLCIGEILWDLIGDEKYLGGAPLNAAGNLAAMGAEAWILSCLGDDCLGREAEQKMLAAGIDTSLVNFSAEYPTGTAIVHPELDGNERFELPYPVAYDRICLTDCGRDRLLANRPDGFIFGSLGAHRSRTVRECIEELLGTFPGAVSLYDVNLRKDYFDRELVEKFTSLSTVMKLNDGEVEILSSLLFGKNLGIKDFACSVLEKLGCKYVVVTKGGDGAEMFWQGGNACVSGISAEVVDTVGAGDAFSAGVMLALLAGEDPASALERGNLCGAACVSHAGAFPVK